MWLMPEQSTFNLQEWEDPNADFVVGMRGDGQDAS